MHPLKMYW